MTHTAANDPRGLGGAAVGNSEQQIATARQRAAIPAALDVFGALLVFAAAGCGGEQNAPAAPPANVLLVTLDTTRADALSCYGAPTGATPVFDAIAAEGVRFARAISCSALTPVSHASILTGRYQYRHGLRVLRAGSGYELPADEATLTKILHERGYATAAIHSSYTVSSVFGFRPGFEHFDSIEATAESVAEDRPRWDEKQRRSDDTTARALEWLAEVREPFFLWIHYWDPHDPVLLPPEEYLQSVPREADGEYARSALYAAEVTYLDAQVGRLLAGLVASGKDARTALAVVADHGEGLDDGQRDHGWDKHRMVYEEQVHVPLIMRWPGGPRGVVVEELVRTVDVLPTLLEALGLPLPEELDGGSLLALAAGRGELERRLAYAEQINGYDHRGVMVLERPDAAFLYSVQDDEWKLIYRPHMIEKSELFHLASDPNEVANRFHSEPEIAARLLEDLAARDPWVLTAFPSKSGEPGDAGRFLDALGYTGGNEDEDVAWAWTCPRHLDVVLDERGRHDCGARLVPRVR